MLRYAPKGMSQGVLWDAEGSSMPQAENCLCCAAYFMARHHKP